LESLIKKSSFIPDWPEPYKSPIGSKREEKRGYQDPVVVLHTFYVQILSINLLSSLNRED